MKVVPLDIDIGSVRRHPATIKKDKPIQRRTPLPGNEPRIEPEYLDMPVPVSDPSVIERRVTQWC